GVAVFRPELRVRFRGRGRGPSDRRTAPAAVAPGRPVRRKGVAVFRPELRVRFRGRGRRPSDRGTAPAAVAPGRPVRERAHGGYAAAVEEDPHDDLGVSAARVVRHVRMRGRPDGGQAGPERDATGRKLVAPGGFGLFVAAGDPGQLERLRVVRDDALDQVKEPF
ncbi:MAG: hypothetical protein BJ554DRAFT_3122, partial [Olpidium bornovanus]